jgi:hypothetical protein
MDTQRSGSITSACARISGNLSAACMILLVRFFFLVRIQQTRARIQYHTCVPCLHARPDRVQQMAVSRVRTQQPDGGIHIFLYPNTPAPPGCSTHAGRMFSRILRARNHATRLPAQEEKEAPPGCCHREAETHEVCCRIR